jgi:hypothetical protein
MSRVTVRFSHPDALRMPDVRARAAGAGTVTMPSAVSAACHASRPTRAYRATLAAAPLLGGRGARVSRS